MLLRYIPLAMLAALASCQTPEQINTDLAATTAQPPPVSIRVGVANAARDFLVDPYSVRDAEISGLLPGSGSAVCVKFNAKNQVGGYTGREVGYVPLRDGKPVNYFRNWALCRMPGVVWHPFPEANALRDL